MERPAVRTMDVTMKAATALNHRLVAEEMHSGLEIRPTYASPDQRDADGEITVYRSGMVPLVSEINC